MSDVFMSALEDRTNVTYTENDAVAKKTTKSNVLDLFAQGGAMRNRKEQDIYKLFNRAYVQNPLLALRTASGLFYHKFKQQFQLEFKEVYKKEIKELKKNNLINEENQHIYLTARGKAVANEVFVKFLLD